MYYIYILYSPSSGHFYIGSTSNLQGRLAAHNHPKNKGWTRSFQPWNIVRFETFDNKAEAVLREKYLKSIRNKEFLKKLINTQ